MAGSGSARPGIPILMYHCVFDSPAPIARWPATVQRYAVPVGAFERQIHALVASGYSTIPLIALLPEAPPIAAAKPVVLTFDDGWASDHRLVPRLLDGVGWRSEHFITVDWVGRDGFLTWEQVAELADHSAGIHSHSLTHPDLERLDRDGVRRELEVSKRLLEARVGRPVEFFALPGGTGATSEVVDLARAAGYRGICTSVIGLNRQGDDPFALRRIAVTRTTALPTLLGWAAGTGLRRAAAARKLRRRARLAFGPRLYERLGAVVRRLRAPWAEGGGSI